MSRTSGTVKDITFMSSESKKEGESEKVFVESRAENFPKVATDMNLHI